MSHCASQKEYNAEIRSIALDAVKRSHDGEGDVDELLEETIDSHTWVTYTYSARWVNVWTESPNAWDDEGIYETRPTTEQEAYWSMLVDCRDLVRHVEKELDEAAEEAADAGSDKEVLGDY